MCAHLSLGAAWKRKDRGRRTAKWWMPICAKIPRAPVSVRHRDPRGLDHARRPAKAIGGAWISVDDVAQRMIAKLDDMRSTGSDLAITVADELRRLRRSTRPRRRMAAAGAGSEQQPHVRRCLSRQKRRTH